MTDHLQVADVLDDAADRIEKYGLARGQGHDGLKACTVAACNDAALSRGFTSEYIIQAGSAPDRAIDAVWAQVEDRTTWPNVVAWSDNSPEQEVLDAFRLAAKTERRLADGAA